MWSFATEPDIQRKLDWADTFVRTEIEPLDVLIGEDERRLAVFRSEVLPALADQVRAEGCWAWHLRPEDGGMGTTQVNLALLNEVVGRSTLAPMVFGSPGADSGNMEILARFGSDDQRRRFLEPLASGQVRSTFAATEPQGGADPQVFATTAVLDGDEWLLNGEKWFASGADQASFLLTLAITDPDAPPRERLSMFVVERDRKGVEIVRDLPVPMHGAGRHAYVRYTDLRVPAANLVGRRGRAFEVMQARMGPARIHMAMRASGMMLRAFEMMCERAKSRITQGGPLADKQLVQAMIADSWTDIEQYRLLVMRTAWKLDELGDFARVRADISALKSVMPDVLHRVVRRSIQVHGSLGLTTELPLMTMLVSSLVRGIGDGPTEVHKVALAKRVLGSYEASAAVFPAYHLPRLQKLAEERYPQLVI